MMAMAAMADPKAVAADVAMRLGLTTTTLYVYVNGDGTPKAAGQALLDGTHRPGAAAKGGSARPKARPSAPASKPLACDAGGERGAGRGARHPLRRRLAALPARHPERAVLMASTAQLYAVSRATLYRLLRGDRRPKDAHRTDRGPPAPCRHRRSSAGVRSSPQ